jgi:hypothetical protein
MMVALYKTKKELRSQIGKRLNYGETSMFGEEYDPNMQGVAMVGPSAYNRKWYAQVWLTDGVITKVT